MADTFSRKKRSWIMSRIKGRDTKPEKIVRTILKSMGCRIRRYDTTLPGNPDIVLKDKWKIIFVHGCFWHGHKSCSRSRRPSTNRAFWNRKIDGNIERDLKVRRKLKNMGWRILVVWECQLKDNTHLKTSLAKFIGQRTRRSI
jgi:DNA mismatch endonuclease, patch repair protein